MALSERPDLLGELTIRLLGRSLPSGARVADPVVRLAQPLEVARWASAVADLRGPLGTRFLVMPVVLLLTAERVDSLLDDRRPELALFAAWAIQKQHGARARNGFVARSRSRRTFPEPLRAAWHHS